MTSNIASNPGQVTVVLFHHALGLTEGVEDLAASMTQAGYQTITPDLFEGRVFDDVNDGVAFAEELGHDKLIERARQAVAELRHPVVFMGISLGTTLVQYFAQGDDRAVGAVLIAGASDPAWFETHWPDSVDGQLHRVENDPWDDPADVEALLKAAPQIDVFTYGGVGHLFVDPTVADDYDESARSQLVTRVLSFLLDHSAGTEGSSARTS